MKTGEGIVLLINRVKAQMGDLQTERTYGRFGRRPVISSPSSITFKYDRSLLGGPKKSLKHFAVMGAWKGSRRTAGVEGETGGGVFLKLAN